MPDTERLQRCFVTLRAWITPPSLSKRRTCCRKADARAMSYADILQLMASFVWTELECGRSHPST